MTTSSSRGEVFRQLVVKPYILDLSFRGWVMLQVAIAIITNFMVRTRYMLNFDLVVLQLEGVI